MAKIRFIKTFSTARQTFQPGEEHEIGGIDAGSAANAVNSGFAVPIDPPKAVEPTPEKKAKPAK